jgi:hypothetical protein
MGTQVNSKKSLKPLVLDLDQIIPFLRGRSITFLWNVKLGSRSADSTPGGSRPLASGHHRGR